MAKMSPPRRRMIEDNEAAGEMLRIYNEWLADFRATHPIAMPASPASQTTTRRRRSATSSASRGAALPAGNSNPSAPV